MKVVANGPEAARKPLRIDLPCSDFWPANRIAFVPAGVHPPIVELDIFFEIPVEPHEQGFFGRSVQLFICPAAIGARVAGAAVFRRAGAYCGQSSNAAKCFARIQSPPFQNCSTESGVRTSSSGNSLKCVSS